MTTRTPDTYIPDATYATLLDRLEQARPTADRPDLRSTLVEILGECGGIWPASVLNDPARVEGYEIGRANLGKLVSR